MKKFLLSAGVFALAAGTAHAADRAAPVAAAPTVSFAAQDLWLDALRMDGRDLWLDALGLQQNDLWLDALSLSSTDLWLDALGFERNDLWLDALGMEENDLWLDALGMGEADLWLDALTFNKSDLWLDALGLGAKDLWLDALRMDAADLWLDALSMQQSDLWLDALSGNTSVVGGDVFWGSFQPSDLWLDALGYESQDLWLDALDLWLDALGGMASNDLWLDALSFEGSDLWLDALGMEGRDLWLDALNMQGNDLWLDALDMQQMDLWLDALDLWLDALDVEQMDLWLDALSMQEADLWLDALGGFEERDLWLDALDLWLDALQMGELDLWLDALGQEGLDGQLDALAKLTQVAEGLKALDLWLDALDMEQRDLWLDALGLEQKDLWLDALGNVGQMADQLGAMGEALTALGKAYEGYATLLNSAEGAFGGLVSEQTGQSFADGFLDGFLAKHGLEGNGFAGFLKMTEGERAAFLIDFSDQLTTYLGIDHPDHWMGTVLWSPRIAEVAGFGSGVTVGVVDQGFDGPGGLAAAPEAYGPVHEGQNHGRAVSGVLAGAIDNRGVMGVAPGADIVLANPFAEHGEAEIEDVTRAIARVGASGASIINLSLGEAGKTFSADWLDTFGDFRVRAFTRNALFVMASGNDGVVQEDDVDFGSLDTVNRIMLVGALGLDGEIASFSNTPGDACFISNGACTPMMERFLVAPGQQILVSTEDGVGRGSGTSYAAPMVSGAAALLQSRWQWLKRSPEATAEILFRSATDLGEEGVDGTYGWGLLNVEGSQLPLDMNALHFRTWAGALPIADAGLSPQLMARLDRRSRVTVFETVGNTFRDFEIPVEVLKAGAIDPSVSLEQDVERYFAERLGVPAGATHSVAGLGFAGTNGFTDTASLGAVSLGGEASGWTLSLAARQPAHGLAVPEGALAFETHGVLTAKESGLTVSFGAGDGALAFSGAGFAMTSDHDIRTGGVNPLLGLASGGRYLHAALPLGERFTLSGGVSARDTADLVVNPFSGALSERIAGTEGYRATAAAASLAYAVGEGSELRLGVTSLAETDGFLGGQSVGALSFGETMRSTSMSAGFTTALPAGMTLALDATATRSVSGFGAQGLLGTDGDVLGTAYQAALAKGDLVRRGDRVRVSFAQPLHIETGALSVGSLGVVDRESGQLGLVADTIDLNGAERRYVGEVLYGTPVLSGRGELSLFGQLDTAPVLAPEEPATTGGLRFTVSF